MALRDDISLLAAVPLFSGLDGEQIRLIAFGAERQTMASGSILFHENEDADCAYVIVHGNLLLTVTDRDGQIQTVSQVGEGVMLSELALISPVQRKYTARAATHIEVISITRTMFHRLLEEYPAMALKVQSRIKQSLATLVDGAAAMAHRFT